MRRALNRFGLHATPYNYDSDFGNYRSLEHTGENELQQEVKLYVQTIVDKERGEVTTGGVSVSCRSIMLRHVQLK